MTAPVRFETWPPQPIRFHPYANMFPLLAGEALDALREDIRRNGVIEPIVMLGDEMLDGRNRYLCARDLGRPYPVTDYDGDDPLGYVLSLNLTRRHLTESQRANIAARIANMPQGARTDLHSANLPKVSQADAAARLSVSIRSVTSAKQVQDDAPDLVPAIEAGSLSVSLAQKVAALPAEDIKAVVAAPVDEIREVAREAVKRAHVLHASGGWHWYTPPAIAEAARLALGGIDLDPASSEIANRTVKASRYFIEEQDALAQDWPIGRLFLNPPFAKVAAFAGRFAAEIDRGSVGITLTNNCTETSWFHDLAATASAICLPRGRIRFLDPSGNPTGSPLQGQALLYFGPDADKFREAFAEIGLTSLWCAS